MRKHPSCCGGFSLGAPLFLLAVLVATAAVFLWYFHPTSRDASTLRPEGLDSATMQESVSPERVRAHLEKILSFGRRVVGSPGYYETARHIQEMAQQGGWEISTLPFRSVTPVNERRELIDLQTGQSIEVYPFLPNLFQPATTAPDGVKGELILLDDEAVLTRKDFSGTIGVIDAANLPKGFGLDWFRYAQLGIQGLILAHRDGLEAIDWEPLITASPMTSTLPVNFPRAAAGADIFSLLGQQTELHIEGHFRNLPASNIVARLRAPQPAGEALVVTAGYDSWSVLPDLVPGVIQAGQLATALALMEGITQYRDSLTRDVVFIFSGAQMMADQGDGTILAILGPALDQQAAQRWLEEESSNNAKNGKAIEEVSALFADPALFEDAAKTMEAMSGLNQEAKRAFQDQLTYVLNTIVFETAEAVLQAEMDWDGQDGTPEAERFQKKRLAANDAMAAAGLRVESLLGSRMKFVREFGVRQQMEERLQVLTQHHGEKAEFYRVGEQIHKLLESYSSLLVFSPRLAPGAGKESVGFVLGDDQVTRNQGPIISRLAASLQQETGLEKDLNLISTTDEPPNRMIARLGYMPINSLIWNRFSYPAFLLANTNRLQSYRAMAMPLDLPFMHDLDSIGTSLRFAGELVFAMAHGEGRFRAPLKSSARHFAGTILLSGVGRSLTPNYPLAHALVGNTVLPNIWLQNAGRFPWLLVMADPYGVYDTGPSPAVWTTENFGNYSPQAVGFDADGKIHVIKDEGVQSQKIFRSTNLSLQRGRMRDINIVTFRADPFPILDMLNPQSLRPYENAIMFTREGLAGVDRFNRFSTEQAQVTFLEPAQPVYVTMRAGSPENELVQSIRGFLLGPPDPTDERMGGISGKGYRSGRLPGPMVRTSWDLAESMLRLNNIRLELQEETNLADERTIDFNNKAAEFLGESNEAESRLESLLLARNSATYSTMVHPVLRKTIFDAVISIVWYLGLLVPFVFFFEKLVFGFPDIRKQLAAQSVIFLVVFGLLHILHPAFGMIRSSFMILLGFIILLISGGITILFAGKFRENLEELKQKRGQVSAAEVDKMGIVGTAFMLGLNNMHRRKVRTGLTCATLVLITFAMIAFTSIHSDVVDTEVATGPADYQGLLLKSEDLAPIGSAEQFGIQTKYGFDHSVARRSMYLGILDRGVHVLNPELEIVYQSKEMGSRSVRFNSILQFSHNEPLQKKMGVQGDYWFPAPSEKEQDDSPSPVIIPRSMAETLGMGDPAEVGPIPVTINGGAFLVTALFDSDTLNNLTDLDGQSLLPFDVEGILTLRRIQADVVAGPEEARIPASNLVLMPEGSIGISVPNSNLRTVSMAVVFNDLDYREARDVIITHLEQTGQQTFYGLDGVSYMGSRMRHTSLEGLLDLIIPLVIAGLTVLNTMKGSVYERRDELYVYNAVGIAPRYIFFMFIAEAFVYAVMGAVLGYLLSQGTGRILTEIGMTGGLNMTFAGLNSIYASLAVMIAVFLSTYFPARSAMQIASPAEESGWDLPEPEGDELAFNLPFTFDARDRVAVLAFFRRFLLDHGEGGSGRFTAGEPEFDMDYQGDDPVPVLATGIWLKPFDLGVAQMLRISLPYDEETEEYIAHISITRSSGTRESWQRLNHSFMVLLRKQFLHWRAVSPAQKKEFYAEVRSLMEGSAQPLEAAHG